MHPRNRDSLSSCQVYMKLAKALGSVTLFAKKKPGESGQKWPRKQNKFSIDTLLSINGATA